MKPDYPCLGSQNLVKNMQASIMIQLAQLDDGPEIFYSLQGEGPRMGTPAVFLRLAGCNLHCSWCDTKYSWKQGLSVSVQEVAERIKSFDCPSLVITGGEPLMQQAALEQLLLLLPQDVFIEVETNGTVAPSPALLARVGQWNVSPKLVHAGNAQSAALCPPVLETFASLPHAWFKFVVIGEQDWRTIAALKLPQERIVLMPCATSRAALDAARPAVAEMCLKHRVRLGERMHLVLWDTKKGV